jgi:hypothetical protein
VNQKKGMVSKRSIHNQKELLIGENLEKEDGRWRGEIDHKSNNNLSPYMIVLFGAAGSRPEAPIWRLRPQPALFHFGTEQSPSQTGYTFSISTNIS